MSGGGIPDILTNAKLIFFKYEENFTSRNSVRLQVDPTPYILYWRYKDYKVFNTKELAHEKNYIYLERIYDVRVGKPTDFDLVLHEKNFEKNFLTVVSGTSITTLKYTHFVCLDNDEKKLQNFATSLFNLVQRVRREEHGLLYHFRKKLAPKMYAAFTQRCLEEEFSWRDLNFLKLSHDYSFLNCLDELFSDQSLLSSLRNFQQN